LTAPQVPQVLIAIVMSVPNTEASSPPIALPSSVSSSTINPPSSLASRAEPFGLDPPRRVPQPDQAGRDRLDEARRPADVGPRPLPGRPGHLGQHLPVHPPGVAVPRRRAGFGARAGHLRHARPGGGGA